MRLNNVVAGSTCNTPALIHLIRRCTLEILYLFPPDDNTPQKKCTGPCGRTLDATPENFHRNKSEKSGLNFWCKQCRKEEHKALCEKRFQLASQPYCQDITEKKCTGSCGRMLPATAEFFSKNRRTKDGLLQKCKQCALARKREIKAAKRHPVPEGYKHCRKCKKEYPFTSEYWPTDKRRESGLCGPCKQCMSKHHAKIYVEKRDLIVPQHRQYKATHKKEIKEYNHRHYVENKEVHLDRTRRDRIRYKERHRAYELWYRATHREATRAIANRRRARKLAAGGTYTAKQIQEQLARQKHKCYYCQKKLKKQGDKYIYHVEHVVPLSKGGSNDISNIVASCPFCNNSKGTRLLHEWPRGGRLI